MALLRKLLVCCLLLLGSAAGQAAPAAGVVISNTAYATFVDSATQLSVRLTSDTVNTRVNALEALTLTSNQNLLIAIGAPFAISHTLTNTGNTDSTFKITAGLATGAGFAPANLQVVQDLNGNGTVEAGEPVVPASGIALAAGARVQLLVTGLVPRSGAAGERAQVVLSAASVAQGARASNTDTLTLTAGAAVQVVLSASVAAATPAQPVTWTAIAVNSGSVPGGAMAIAIDGTPTNAFVLRVPVPANANFDWAGASTNVSSRRLFHLAASAAGSFVTAVPAGAAVDAVAWAMSELPAGGSLQGQFRVVVGNNAAGNILDTAYADWSDQGALLLATSNTVVLPLPARPARIGFFTNNRFDTEAGQASPGQPLFVQADAALCNADPVHVDTVPVTVVSQLTGDVETFVGVETGPNTGLFRIQPNVPTANGASHVVASGDGLLEVLRNDLVTASITGCGSVSASASTSLLIDPSGVVYDSRSNLPLAGATVELIDMTGAGNGGRAGSAATVLQLDGLTAALARVVTGADGVYLFPLVQPSTYQIRVTPPTGLVFPSKLPTALQPAGRLIDTPGSFGGSFTVARGAVRFDVPLDTGGSTGLLVQKTASRASAEVGDVVDYSVKVNNALVVPLPAMEVHDMLPAGFTYVRGSARLEGAALADPAGGTGPQLVFAIGTVAAGAKPTLTYRVRLGAGSQGGNGINTAQAIAGGVVSNRATARVQVSGGVFSGDAYLIGKVFADCNRDGVQGGDEPGLPGVRIYLEDGTYAVTDEAGKYSLYGLTPRTHVAKLDRTTLPAGASLVVLNNRNAMDAGSRFIDLTNGELHKADFAIAECDAGVRQQIAARRHALGQTSEIAQAAGVLLSVAAPAATGDARTLPASGTLGLPGSGARVAGASDTAAPTAPALGAVADTGGPVLRPQHGVNPPIYTPAAALLPSQSVAAPAPAEALAQPAAVQPLEELLPQLGPETAFVGLQDGQVMEALQTRVRVKGPLGAVFDLQVNGRPVPATQVGKKSSLEDKRVTAWEYIGVDLRPGRNTLAVKVTDPFGNVRGQAQIVILAPGPLAAIRIEAPERPVADTETPITVRFALRDADGLPVTARTQLTLQATAGQWQVTDADPHQPGAQVMVEGGTGSFALLPPAQPGKVEIAGLAGTIKATTTVEFVPKLRPLLAAGLVEGTINLRNLNPASLQPTQSGDVFEREIQRVSHGFASGKGEVGARAALFLKGKVLGSSLLTLAYDSDKAADARLFRDIQPNQFYPVYGDSSARGFDGQSSGRLYLLLQNGSNYALVGDFATQTDDPARQLTQYARSLNGAKGHWSDGKISVEAFASRTSATQIVQEFRANGTSGPFQLRANGVLQSEQVHVITRSRDQNALVLKDAALTVFNDYTIEPFTGLLLLKAPIASVDADLNPVFVRVVYEVENGGPKHAVSGVEATVQVMPGVTVGALAVRDEDPANRQQLAGLTLTGKLAEKTVLTAEVARSRTDLQGSGSGERVELTHEAAGVQVHAWGARTDAGFYNPGSPQSAGQAQYGAKIGYSLDASNRIVGEALKTSNGTTGAQQTGAELRLEHSLPGNAVLEVGVRHSSSNAQAALQTTPAVGTETTATATGITTTAAAVAAASGPETSTTSARVKLTVPVPGVAKADAYAVGEQAIDGSGGREIGVGANYAVNANTKLYVRHDFINSLNGAYTLTSEASRYTSVAGVTTVLPDNTQVFNEYRVADAVDGRTAEAAIGLRKTVQLTSGLNVNGSLQRIKPLSGAASDDSTAIALGAEYTAAADWKASGQVQWQDSTTSRSWLASGAVVNKLDAEWTLLNRLLYNEQINSGAGAGSRELITAQGGVAFRPVDSDRWNALGRIEYKRDRDNTVAPARDVASWLLSTHVNVQPNSAWIISGRYAARWMKDASGNLSTSSFTQLLGGRSGWDISDRWNVGLQAYGLWGNGSSEAALGVEVGYLAYKNLWLAAGYNFKGFSAPDLSADAHTQRGAYLRLRFKFDEDALEAHGSHPGADTTAPRVQ